MITSRVHGLSGIVALLTVLCFWSATVLSELFMSHEAVAFVKRSILYGLVILIPSIAFTGASGAALGRKRGGRILELKKKRMKMLAITGLLIMLPLAVFLHWKSAVNEFDALFYAIQALELAGGIVQFTLLAKNFRAGLNLAKGSTESGLHGLLGS